MFEISKTAYSRLIALSSVSALVVLIPWVLGILMGPHWRDYLSHNILLFLFYLIIWMYIMLRWVSILGATIFVMVIFYGLSHKEDLYKIDPIMPFIIPFIFNLLAVEGMSLLLFGAL